MSQTTAEVRKEESMVLQKEMIGNHYKRLSQAREQGKKKNEIGEERCALRRGELEEEGLHRCIQRIAEVAEHLEALPKGNILGLEHRKDSKCLMQYQAVDGSELLGALKLIKPEPVIGSEEGKEQQRQKERDQPRKGARVGGGDHALFFISLTMP